VSRLFRRFVSALAVAATLLWGFAGIAAPGHEAAGSPVVSASAHGGSDAEALPDTCDENSAGGFDRCCPPGCSFSAVTPIPSGTVLRALATVSVLAPDAFVPLGSSAPPLRPPRAS
jgi:hypothetical protein